jgi:hypothetical protein
MVRESHSSMILYLLGGLLAFGALNAFGGGYYGLAVIAPPRAAPDGPRNLALGRPATGSLPCSDDQGPEKAVNGSVAGGETDRWCAEDRPWFLQVDLGATRPVTRFVVNHASAGGVLSAVPVSRPCADGR